MARRAHIVEMNMICALVCLLVARPPCLLCFVVRGNAEELRMIVDAVLL
jgi:metal-responsive CopG/Arc/MetJ family transcriptional regulator